jgi:hypothetical protein
LQREKINLNSLFKKKKKDEKKLLLSTTIPRGLNFYRFAEIFFFETQSIIQHFGKPFYPVKFHLICTRFKTLGRICQLIFSLILSNLFLL